MRRAVTLHESLSGTLQFLATGWNYEDLKFSAAISAQAQSKNSSSWQLAGTMKI
jgi:hypothetical protein